MSYAGAWHNGIADLAPASRLFWDYYHYWIERSTLSEVWEVGGRR
jgi:hypothetical protein